MNPNATARAARKAGETFVIETRDNLSSLLRQLRRAGATTFEEISDELAGLLADAKDEGEKNQTALQALEKSFVC